MTNPGDAETARIHDSQSLAWRRWGPYLSERQWGTVREDYSADGDAWNYLPHDHARSRAYRWGEDGIGGFADDCLRICMSVALWNGHDPILKERLYGLTNEEGNHGEDVKELYYYVDGVPSHAYMKMVYKYPQGPFPYEQLRTTNATRGLDEGEFELIDTGALAENRYFDIEIEYAKADTDDILLRIVAYNRGPDAAPLHILPQIWFRNCWAWAAGTAKPGLADDPQGGIAVNHPDFAPLYWQFDGGADAGGDLLFCDNETNTRRLYGSEAQGWFKDGINDAVTAGQREAVNPAHRGTKAAAHVVAQIPAGGSHEVRVRLAPAADKRDLSDFGAIVAARRAEADAFYAVHQANIADADARTVHRQALAGMLWGKQFYGYDVWRWLKGDPLPPTPPAERWTGRNKDWQHLAMGDVDVAAGGSGDILSMPDSWEYPWFAAWDMAFQAVTLATIDPDFAKHQLLLLTQARALHPSGQMPAYEWNFDDVNPPVHAWAALEVFRLDRDATGTADISFLKRVFHKLLLNFTWWVNREDADGNNIFQGGFLGLDNIGIFDLRQPLPNGGRLDQSDGTAWAATYALNMLAIALVLAREDHAYEDLATKFFEHFVFIAEAVHSRGEQVGDEPGTGLWDEEDQFYYDVFRVSGAAPRRLKIRSLVGLLPIFANLVLPADYDAALPKFRARLAWFAEHRPDLAALVTDWQQPGPDGLRSLSLLRKHRLNAILTRMLDETEFLSPHGIRSVSKYHEAHPFSLAVDGQTLTLNYEPGEGRTRIYGGNSNWRGPVWMPMNYLIVASLRQLHRFYGDSFQMALPTGSTNLATLGQIADELSRRLAGLFLRGQSGERAYLGTDQTQQHDKDFAELLQFFEYFHGDTGQGLGASHQTGWTGLIALLIAQTDKDLAP